MAQPQQRLLVTTRVLQARLEVKPGRSQQESVQGRRVRMQEVPWQVQGRSETPVWGRSLANSFSVVVRRIRLRTPLTAWMPSGGHCGNYSLFRSLTLTPATAISVQACEAPPPPVENSIMCRS